MKAGNNTQDISEQENNEELEYFNKKRKLQNEVLKKIVENLNNQGKDNLEEKEKE